MSIFVYEVHGRESYSGDASSGFFGCRWRGKSGHQFGEFSPPRRIRTLPVHDTQGGSSGEFGGGRCWTTTATTQAAVRYWRHRPID